MKIQIAIPSRGDVRSETLSSVVALTTALDRGGIAFRLSQYHYYDVAESRNHLARTFLEDAEATHLLFVDADMGFAPEAVARLIAFEAPVVGAIYPRRGLSPERVVHLARELPDLAIEQVIAQARNYVLFNGSWEGEPVPRGAKDGFLRVNGIGMGLTLLARTAMEQLIAADQAPLIESQTGDGVFHDLRLCLQQGRSATLLRRSVVLPALALGLWRRDLGRCAKSDQPCGHERAHSSLRDGIVVAVDAERARQAPAHPPRLPRPFGPSCRVGSTRLAYANHT
ncbi:MAG: hypothetical protein AAF674_14475 [Pseudomonadota bacterium]